MLSFLPSIIAMNAAGFAEQADVVNDHVFLNGLAHIIHRQRCGGDGGQRFHFHTGAPGMAGRGAGNGTFPATNCPATKMDLWS